jgi:hypothetical protein
LIQIVASHSATPIPIRIAATTLDAGEDNVRFTVLANAGKLTAATRGGEPLRGGQRVC